MILRPAIRYLRRLRNVRWLSAAVLVGGLVLAGASYRASARRESAWVNNEFTRAAEDCMAAIQRGIDARSARFLVVRRLLSDGHTAAEITRVLENLFSPGDPGISLLWYRQDQPLQFANISEFGAPFHAPACRLPEIPDVLHAAEESLRTGRTVASRAFHCDGDPSGSALVAISSGTGDSRSGAVVLVFSVNDLLDHALRPLRPVRVSIGLTDASEPDRRIALRNADPPAPDSLRLFKQTALATRVWNLEFAADPGTLLRERGSNSLTLLICLALLALGFAIVFDTLMSYARRTRETVERRTRQLRHLNQQLQQEAAGRVRAEREWRMSEELLKLAQESGRVGIWHHDLVTGRTTASPQLYRLFGIPPEREFPVGNDWLAMVHPDDRERVQAAFDAACANRACYESEYRILLPDGSQRWLLGRGCVVADPRGNLRQVAGASVDISAFKAAEQALEESRELFHRVFSDAGIGIVVMDLAGKVVEVNQSCCEATGFSREEILAMHYAQIFDSEAGALSRERLRELLYGNKAFYSCEAPLRRKDGAVFWSRLRVSPMRKDGLPSGLIAVCEDITERKEAQALLAYQALHDSCTNLPNRRNFDDVLNRAIAECHAQNSRLALLYIDLDGFKTVNDTAGHAVGDELLSAVTRRLLQCLGRGSVLARIGGDEFSVVIPRASSRASVEIAATAVLREVEQPFLIGGHELYLTASIGITMLGEAVSPEALLQQADLAMYAAKNGGRNRFCWFRPELGQAAHERASVEKQLRTALSRGEMSLFFQPEYDLQSGGLVRFEALARWRHPDLGIVPPSKFIPIAENCGLIASVGAWVLESACHRAARWQEACAMQIAVNVSSLQFFQDDFVETVQRVLEETGLDPHLLQLELTESVVLRDLHETAAKMARLRQLGVSLAIDDFGTGYSSLSYLQGLPFDVLKVDRSFVRNVSHDPSSQAMIRSLVALAHNLRMNVVIEGVENYGQLEIAQQLGCDAAQGFLLGRPTPAPEIYMQPVSAAVNTVHPLPAWEDVA